MKFAAVCNVVVVVNGKTHAMDRENVARQKRMNEWSSKLSGVWSNVHRIGHLQESNDVAGCGDVAGRGNDDDGHPCVLTNTSPNEGLCKMLNT